MKYQDFPSKFFCLRVPKIWYGKPSVLCFRNFLVAKKFMDKREGVQNFLSKFVCLTVPKYSVGESFSASLISGTDKVWMQGGGSIKFFCRMFFCLTVPKHSVGKSVSLSLFSGIEKVWIRGKRVSIFSAENFLFHSAKKIGNGTLLCCVSENFRLRKSLWIRGGGGFKIFCRKIFVSQCRNIPYVNPSVFH